MIGYALLIYIGVRIGAAWWYYLLIALGVLIKIVEALINVHNS